VKNLQKAAMFGLDARIALAIFAALSVITGAVLYNAIKQAKVTAIITEMNNINNALTEYYLHTGTLPPLVGSGEATYTRGGLEMEELITSSVKGWKGPYVENKDNTSTTDGALLSPIYSSIRLFSNQSIDWDYPRADTKCLSGSDRCFVYICYYGMSEELNKALDLKIDGTAEATKGDLRYLGNCACKKGMIYDTSLAPAA